MAISSIKAQFKPSYLIIGVVVAIFVIACVLFVGQKSPKSNPAISQTPPPSSTAIVEITPHGFFPSTLAITPNTEVTWVNEDVLPHLPAAAPYPSHSSLPNLIAPRALGQKETYSYLFTKQGNVEYLDQLHPTSTGEIEIR